MHNNILRERSGGSTICSRGVPDGKIFLQKFVPSSALTRVRRISFRYPAGIRAFSVLPKGQERWPVAAVTAGLRLVGRLRQQHRLVGPKARHLQASGL